MAAEALSFSKELQRRPFLSVVAYDRFDGFVFMASIAISDNC